jgi:hypothetical protein
MTPDSLDFTGNFASAFGELIGLPLTAAEWLRGD